VDKSEERKEAKLIVGPDIKMKGVEVTDCDTLVVEGRIEATLDSRVLQIAQNGVFSGTVAVDTAEIHGRLEGDLTVRKQLTIHATGKVCSSGTCDYGSCDAGWGNCDGNDANGCETDLRTTAAHCGACNAACSTPAHSTATCSGRARSIRRSSRATRW